jgi:serine/threonine protein kinase
MHSNDIAHRDIKPENLLLDKNYNLKIADFGLSAALPKDGEKYTEQCGSQTFMLPEIHQNKSYDGKQADLFAASVVLFIMLTGFPPFTKAS